MWTSGGSSPEPEKFISEKRNCWKHSLALVASSNARNPGTEPSNWPRQDCSHSTRNRSPISCKTRPTAQSATSAEGVKAGELRVTVSKLRLAVAESSSSTTCGGCRCCGTSSTTTTSSSSSSSSDEQTIWWRRLIVDIALCSSCPRFEFPPLFSTVISCSGFTRKL